MSIRGEQGGSDGSFPAYKYRDEEVELQVSAPTLRAVELEDVYKTVTSERIKGAGEEVTS